MTSPSETPSASPAFDGAAFRQALAAFPTGVTVLTALGEGGAPVGMTVSSFNTLSLDPPLILWSVDRSAPTVSVWTTAERFAVNVLSAEQADLSNHFARSAPDKFAGIDWTPGLGGVPLLAGTAARFECTAWARHDGGDHVLIIGKVDRLDRRDGAEPLVYGLSRYNRLAPLEG